jgi:Rod binding domain-containing protein
MLSEQLGRQTAKAGGIGIADRLLNPNVMAARVTRF